MPGWRATWNSLASAATAGAAAAVKMVQIAESAARREKAFIVSPSDSRPVVMNAFLTVSVHLFRRVGNQWTLQRLSIPAGQVGRRCVGLLQEGEQQRVRIARLAHRVIRQDKLPETAVVEGFGRAQPRVAAGRLRIGINVECRAAI